MRTDADRIALDLKGLLRGDVHFEDSYRAIYARAACIYRIRPLGTVMPRDEEDVVKLVGYARERGVSLTGRGAGPALAGQTVNRGIIVDFSRYMKNIKRISEEGSATVEPGIVRAELNKELGGRGRFFPPDPSSSDYCTVGGMVANNSSGPRSVKYGVTSDYVESLVQIDHTGERLVIGGDFTGSESGKNVLDIVNRHNHEMDKYPAVVKNSSGYNLKDFQTRPTTLICGSEGTLGLITEITFRTLPDPSARATGLVFFDKFEKAVEAVAPAKSGGAAAVEILDETFLELLRKEKNSPCDIPQRARGALIIEKDGRSEEEAAGGFDDIMKCIGPSALTAERAYTAADNERLWSFRKSASPILNRLPGRRKSVRFIEDPVVPPSRLIEFTAGLKKLLARRGVFAVIFGHAGDGNFHVNPLLDLNDPSDVRLMKAIARETHELIERTGGALSGEHGDGRLRSASLPRFYGGLYGAFEEIKSYFDPDDMFNPGIIAGRTRMQDIDENLRPSERPTSTAGSELARREIERCSGCGKCRSFCPPVKTLNDESSGARGRMHFFQGLLRSETNVPPSPADLCTGCRRCEVLCPVNIDVFLPSAEFKVSGGLRDGILARSGRAVELLEKVPERVLRFFGTLAAPAPLGISQDAVRLLPRPPSLRKKYGRVIEGKGQEIAYFPGCYAGSINPAGFGEPVVEVLRKLNLPVSFPDFQCCGIPALNNGNMEIFAESARKNAWIINGLAEKGRLILTACPSCFLALTKDYPKYFPGILNTDALERIVDFHEFISYETIGPGRPPAEDRAVLHIPCHTKAADKGEHLRKLMESQENLDVHVLNDGCCGMSGTFGLKRDNGRLAAEIGKKLFREIEEAGARRLITPCGMCALQFEKHTPLKAVHPARVLLEAL